MLHYSAIQTVEEHQDELTILEIIPTEVTFPYVEPYKFEINGCCDGMICIASSCETSIGLWNPYTNLYRRLPHIRRWKKRHSLFGIGYDSSIDDYKIVRFPAMCSDAELKWPYPPFRRKDFWTVYVMTLRSNVWRKVHHNFPYIAPCEEMAVVAANGSRLYWFALDGNNRCELLIVSFDLAEETATKIQMPPGSHYQSDDEDCCLSLGVLQGCISFACHDKSNNCFDVWMMVKEKEGASQEDTWIKFLKFPLNHFGGPGHILKLTPQFITENGALVMRAEMGYPRKSERYRELIYDPKQGTCKVFYVAGVSGREKFQAFNFSPSLVSLSSDT